MARGHEMESLNYVSVEHDAFLQSQKNRTKKDDALDEARKWITCSLIGICTGITSFSVHWIVEKIIHIKYGWMDGFVYFQSQELVHLGFLIFLSCNLLLATLSLLIVLVWKPAGGSGLPEVKGYLNGTRIPKALNVITLLTKVVSMIFSVSAQMPAEGPFIHIGAMIGGGLGEFKSRTLRFQLPLMKSFRNSRDKRDFISSGAAAGVSAAFGSPIGGLLFSLEEVSSYWSQSLTWRTFFTCLMATFTANIFVRGFFGYYDLYSITIFNVSITKGYHVYEIPIFVLIGCLCGVIGGIFCKCNVTIQKWRRDYLHRSRIRTAVELWLVVLIVSTVFFYLPMISACRPRFQYEHEENSKIELRSYLCPPDSMYNEMATLSLSKMEDTIRNLFAREVPHRFSMTTLIVFFLVYLTSACYAAGTALTAGLLIPTMIFGASFGRFIGLAVRVITDVDLDPGTYAVIGAAAATGGITRMTVSLTVIMLEITNDLNYLFPIMLSVICAKWVGDFISHPLYDSLLQLKGVNLLEPDPTLQMKALKCSEAMSANPLCLNTKAKVADIVHVLTESYHNSFPVVKDKLLIGLVTRAYLLITLKFHVLRNVKTKFTTRELDDILNEKRIVLSEMVPILSTKHYSEMVVDLTNYIHRSTVVVYHDSSLTTAYRMFRSLGLRQLVVVNHKNEPVGMITRIDLSHEHIDQMYNTAMKNK
ncbi:chloride channel protein C [Acrasis kona]|uniref:Chloride channel protein n=1 Tax=Acrasis kona TaxID=1008807 RepID=A0AAW2YHI6_9EUKA